MNNSPLEQLWALKLVWAVNVQNYTILPGTLPGLFHADTAPLPVSLGGGHRPQPLGLAPGAGPAAVRDGVRRALPAGCPGPVVRVAGSVGAPCGTAPTGAAADRLPCPGRPPHSCLHAGSGHPPPAVHGVRPAP